jgi:ketosteroid isomerase-like protein
VPVASSAAGNCGSIQWILSGADKGVFKTGKKFKVRGASIITSDHGKISRSIDYYDLAAIMKQVGVLPAS